MNSNRERWLQLALVAVCAALEEVECTDEALTEALFVGLPGVKIDDLTAAAVAEALRRSSHLTEAAALLDRSRGFIYDSLKRRKRDWLTADWVAYGAELRRRRLLAGWSVSELSRRINLSPPTIRQVEQACGKLRPSELTLAKLAAALGMPSPPSIQNADPKSSDGGTGGSPK
jgi:ribosome-binding protein aMBF1 (putative translation factor)